MIKAKSLKNIRDLRYMFFAAKFPSIQPRRQRKCSMSESVPFANIILYPNLNYSLISNGKTAKNEIHNTRTKVCQRETDAVVGHEERVARA